VNDYPHVKKVSLVSKNCFNIKYTIGNCRLLCVFVGVLFDWLSYVSERGTARAGLEFVGAETCSANDYRHVKKVSLVRKTALSLKSTIGNFRLFTCVSRDPISLVLMCK